MADAGRILIAVTGASGSAYALRLGQALIAAGVGADFIFSKAALLVLATETELTLPAKPQAQARELQKYYGCDEDDVRVYGREDWMAPWASGSGQPGPVVICPCSTGTLSAVATGASNNLTERAADVALKERRKLILVPRETPFSEIHLTNMLTLTRMGATVMPACPGFYHDPKSINDLIDFIVARILNQLGIDHKLMPLWGESPEK
ncbi:MULTISPECIES: flavin prenyltransferase UbiX [Thalassolituus]|uniref:flavin prenyltransferase UbiX n=1 Tax=Thalassolituus TaxID=187492 RepID=UPI000C50C63A|nr:MULTISPECIES: flavin prenyltransferase UbiX [Thalassolituus]MAG44239.1 aromatic acid decarboxylase [Oceanospirillaceae bacterium]MAX86043.1 aromatic acid decarboxylase [Oceanospirillaceae bacterium]MEE3159718.1 flavin prenyltransferase UbiX [Pseudomonadota bacterium]|tara:strand:- start:76 stop:696 length:621 start_codon:yes stop_codon:yes gene_type:complete